VFRELGVELRWQGAGIEEKGYDIKTGRLLVDVDPRFFRPAEVELLWGNPSKAEKDLGWRRKVSFQELVQMMVQADVEMVTR